MSAEDMDLDKGLFAIRGNLDGELEEEFTQREQFIGLKIGEEEFYLSISSVNEIGMLQAVTYVPQSHPFLEGVINLRGTIMPAINLRKMMGLHRGAVTASTRMIISSKFDTQFCMLVDGITYVVSLLPSEIEDQSLPGRSPGADLISRIAKSKDSIIGVLDLAKIIRNIKPEDAEGDASDEVEE